MNNIEIKTTDINKSLYIDGKPQMIIPNDKDKISQMGEILFLDKMDNFVNNNTNVLCVGLGAGYTAREILKRNIKSLDIVEVYQSVIDVLKEFDTYDNIINDKRCNIICDEATNYVLNTDKKYDIIIIDVCQPELDVSKNLFQLEFFIDLKNILNENGIILYWYYNIKSKSRKDIAKSTVKSLKKVFNFVDFINMENSIFKDTYFFTSDNIQAFDKDSIIEKIFED